MEHIQTWQWAMAFVAALIIGMSKTGIPGIGILSVTFLAYALEGWTSNGVILPLLILADVFAVIWYHRHTQWSKILSIVPWVVVGIAIGFALLWKLGESPETKRMLNPIVGFMILAMLFLYFAQKWWAKGWTPKSKVGVFSSGIGAGFATAVSNAAGPILSIYFTAHDLPKYQLMGTFAWYALIFNCVKVPLYAAGDIITRDTLGMNLYLAPVVVVGVFAGKWLLPRVSQKVFDAMVLVLAAVGGIQLLFK